VGLVLAAWLGLPFNKITPLQEEQPIFVEIVDVDEMRNAPPIPVQETPKKEAKAEPPKPPTPPKPKPAPPTPKQPEIAALPPAQGEAGTQARTGAQEGSGTQAREKAGAAQTETGPGRGPEEAQEAAKADLRYGVRAEDA
jgi:outer membrane biosynthesis protein TonB